MLQKTTDPFYPAKLPVGHDGDDDYVDNDDDIGVVSDATLDALEMQACRVS